MFNVLLEKYRNLRHRKVARNIIITEHKIKFKLHIFMRSNDDQTNTALSTRKVPQKQTPFKTKTVLYCSVFFLAMSIQSFPEQILQHRISHISSLNRCFPQCPKRPHISLPPRKTPIRKVMLLTKLLNHRRNSPEMTTW